MTYMHNLHASCAESGKFICTWIEALDCARYPVDHEIEIKIDQVVRWMKIHKGIVKISWEWNWNIIIIPIWYKKTTELIYFIIIE